MITVSKANVVFCDMDDTLVSWDLIEGSTEDTIEITNPSTGITGTLRYNKTIIDAFRSHKLRGNGVILWSQAGGEWAALVAKVLGIEDLIDAAISKPRWLLDDKQAECFMPKAVLPKSMWREFNV